MRKIAKLLASEGARIAVVDLDPERAARVAGEIAATGAKAADFVADVANPATVQALVDDVAERFGRIDILVNNVAISDNKHILEITEDEWDRVIAVSLTAPFLMAKYAAARMVSQGEGGKIVNLGLDLGPPRPRPRHRLQRGQKGASPT